MVSVLNCKIMPFVAISILLNTTSCYIKPIMDLPPKTGDKKIIGLDRNSYIRPLLGLSLDTQGYIPVKEIKNVPDELRREERYRDWDNNKDNSVKPPAMIDFRFAKGGLETRFTDNLRLDLYVDVGFALSSQMSDEMNGQSKEPAGAFPEKSSTMFGPYYTALYSPVIIPGYVAELFYQFGQYKELGEAGKYHVMLGARYREFDLMIERGFWRGEWPDHLDRSNAESTIKIADIYERSVYIGIGVGCDSRFLLTLKVGLNFNGIDVPERWEKTINVDRDNPSVFGGLDIGLRF